MSLAGFISRTPRSLMVESISFVSTGMTVLTICRSSHLAVTSQTALVISTLQADPVHMIVRLTKCLPFLKIACGKRIRFMAVPAGHLFHAGAVAVTLCTFRILNPGAGCMVVAYGTVLDDHCMQGMIEAHPFEQFRKLIDFDYFWHRPCLKGGKSDSEQDQNRKSHNTFA